MEKNYNFHNFNFAQYPQLIAAYLFGSQVEAGNHADSDIDIALVVSDDFDFLKKYNVPLIISSKLETIIGNKVDVVIFNKMDPLFKTEIRTKGKLIYLKDAEKLKKVLFKARKEFEDYLELHKYYVRSLKKRYAAHG